jgi:hypothetical protein
VLGARPDKAVHELGREDLAARSGVTEPLGQHDRRAEEVSLVAHGLAGVQPHSDVELLRTGAAVVPVDGPLHRDRAGHRVHRAREDHHEAVAEVLDLLPPPFRDRLAQQREVRAPQPLAGLVAQLVEDLRAAHQVREEERDHPLRRTRDHRRPVARRRHAGGPSASRAGSDADDPVLRMLRTRHSRRGRHARRGVRHDGQSPRSFLADPSTALVGPPLRRRTGCTATAMSPP